MDTVVFEAGEYIIKQGDDGMDLFIVDSGKAFAQIKNGDELKEVRQYLSGDCFGERALLKKESRAASVITRTRTTVLKMSQTQYKDILQPRIERLRGVKLFATMSDEDIEDAARLMKVIEYEAGESIIIQGETGADLFIVEEGEEYAEIKIGGEGKQVMQYRPGGAFGERALLREEPRAASVIAKTNVTTWKLEQSNFKSMIDTRNLKESLIRGANLFETFD